MKPVPSTPHPPPAFVQTDQVARAPLERLGACAELLAPLALGATLPPLWHWLLFTPPTPASALGPDGHPLHDASGPRDPALPSRMWAGGRLHLHRQPCLGATVTRHSAIAQTRDLHGASGRLRFVTWRHTLRDEAGLLAEEEQDLVFRAPGHRATVPDAPPPAPPGAITHVLVPDSVLLFRFSALTFNAHRIHYDRDYARAVEHYADLVVHGPLQAILLAALLHSAAPALALRRFHFRGHAPAFANRALRLQAWPDPAQQGAWQLRTLDGSGALCMAAQAHLEQPEPTGQGPA